MASTDKIPQAISILVATGVVAIVAGFNDQLGKFLLVFMIIVALLWLMSGNGNTVLANWSNIMSGNTKGTQLA